MKSTSSSKSCNPVLQAMTRLACVAWLAWAGGSAQAASIYWLFGASGSYTNPANWNGGVVAGAGDRAIFNSTNNGVVTLTTSVTNHDLYFDANNTFGFENITFNFNTNTMTTLSGLTIGEYGGVNTVYMNNGTFLLSGGAAFGAFSRNYPTTATLTFSNMTLLASDFSVGTVGGGTVYQSTWNLYNSTAMVTNFGMASTGGGTNPGGTANVLVANGSILTVVNSIPVGQYATPVSPKGIITVSNGTFNANGGVILGYNYSGSGYLNILGNGQVYAGGTVKVGQSDSSYGGILLIGSNALFEANTLTVKATSQSTVSNMGGVFQYTSASPAITPGVFSNVSITNGTVSFRAITNADVYCNQSGKPLDSTTKIAWFGTNAFRLNNATNSMAINQAYTFAPGTATNFARLELRNGSTYRNGSVTIGAGGSLYLSSGASTISSVLTAAPSSTIEFDLSNTNAPGCLLSTTNMYLNGCTLQLDLASPPILNTQFLIISNTLASQLSYSFAGGSTKQNFTINGTNYLTTISLAGNGTEVVVQTTIPARGTIAFFH